MSSKIQVKYVNSKLTVLIDGKEIDPEVDLQSSGFDMEIKLDDNTEPQVTVKPALNIKDLDTYMPHKGECIFQIHDESQIPLAYEILKEHVGEIEFEYCPNGFIKAGPVCKNACGLYYGKFEIEDLETLYTKMAEKDVIVINAKFFIEDD